MSVCGGLTWYVYFHGCVYGVFKAVPISQKGSTVRVGSKKVSTVVRKVLCDCVYVGSRIEKNRSASLLVSGRSEVSVNNYHVMVT